MLISEPMMKSKEDSIPLVEENSAAKDDGSVENNDLSEADCGTQTSEERSRRSSCSSLPSTTTERLTRKTSSVTTPSFSTAIRQDDVDNLFARNSTTEPRRRQKRSLIHEPESSGEMTFTVSNVLPKNPVETEHLRKVTVDSLDRAPHVLAQMAALGVKRKRDVARK